MDDDRRIARGMLEDTIAAPPTSASASHRDAEAASTDYADLVTVSPEHYISGEEIARGGMGRIRIARDRRLGRAVALKEILVRAGDATRRFEREARITARLQHPSIVSVHEAGMWPSGEPFYAMKLVTGRSLDEVIADAKGLDERLALLPNVLAIAIGASHLDGASRVNAMSRQPRFNRRPSWD